MRTQRLSSSKTRIKTSDSTGIEILLSPQRLSSSKTRIKTLVNILGTSVENTSETKFQ